MEIISKREEYIDESAPRTLTNHMRAALSRPKVVKPRRVTVSERLWSWKLGCLLWLFSLSVRDVGGHRTLLEGCTAISGASNASVQLCTKIFEDRSGGIALQKIRDYWGTSSCEAEQEQGPTCSVCPRNSFKYPNIDYYASPTLANTSFYDLHPPIYCSNLPYLPNHIPPHSPPRHLPPQLHHRLHQPLHRPPPRPPTNHNPHKRPPLIPPRIINHEPPRNEPPHNLPRDPPILIPRPLTHPPTPGVVKTHLAARRRVLAHQDEIPVADDEGSEVRGRRERGVDLRRVARSAVVGPAEVEFEAVTAAAALER